MIRRWLQKLIIESLQMNQMTSVYEILGHRDPTNEDLHYRHDSRWTNKDSGKKFILKSEWKNYED